MALPKYALYPERSSALPVGAEAGYLAVLPHDAHGRPIGAFSATIRRGVYQLQYAHVPRLSDTLHWVGSLRGAQGAPWPDIHVDVSTLVLVTTAELWTFRRDIDLDAIEGAESLQHIAEPVQAVEFSSVASRELRAHQDEWLRALELRIIKGPPEAEPAKRELWKQVADIVRGAAPSVLIVHHAALETVLNGQAEAIRGKVRQLTEEFARSRGLSVR